MLHFNKSTGTGCIKSSRKVSTPGIATFEKRDPEWEEWDIKFLKNCRIVAISDEKEVLGWALLQLVSQRSVYMDLAGVTVYKSSEHTGKGLGKELLFYKASLQSLMTIPSN